MAFAISMLGPIGLVLLALVLWAATMRLKQVPRLVAGALLAVVVVAFTYQACTGIDGIKRKALSERTAAQVWR